ncbi:hypothetical protein HDU76_009874, partial [Blyttiomyces sp. JEL0837]
MSALFKRPSRSTNINIITTWTLILALLIILTPTTSSARKTSNSNNNNNKKAKIMKDPSTWSSSKWTSKQRPFTPVRYKDKGSRRVIPASYDGDFSDWFPHLFPPPVNWNSSSASVAVAAGGGGPNGKAGKNGKAKDFIEYYRGNHIVMTMAVGESDADVGDGSVAGGLVEKANDDDEGLDTERRERKKGMRQPRVGVDDQNDKSKDGGSNSVNRPAVSDITLFTQTSLDRLGQFPELARRWKGSISLAVYVESAKDLWVLPDRLRELKEDLRRVVEDFVLVSPSEMGAGSNDRVNMDANYERGDDDDKEVSDDESEQTQNGKAKRGVYDNGERVLDEQRQQPPRLLERTISISLMFGVEFLMEPWEIGMDGGTRLRVNQKHAKIPEKTLVVKILEDAGVNNPAAKKAAQDEVQRLIRMKRSFDESPDVVNDGTNPPLVVSNNEGNGEEEPTSAVNRVPRKRSVHHPYDLLYPINALRNLALAESKTDLVFSLDADFLPSERALDVLTSKNIVNLVKDPSKPSVVVVPAFEWVKENMEKGPDMDSM